MESIWERNVRTKIAYALPHDSRRVYGNTISLEWPLHYLRLGEPNYTDPQTSNH